MREIRTYGSEGGEAENGLPYPYLPTAPQKNPQPEIGFVVPTDGTDHTDEKSSARCRGTTPARIRMIFFMRFPKRTA